MPETTHQWRLYGTLGCHLCEQAEQIVEALSRDFAINLEQVDIADDPAWLDAFAEQIPVLENLNNGQRVSWPFDPHILSDWLTDSATQ